MFANDPFSHPAGDQTSSSHGASQLSDLLLVTKKKKKSWTLSLTVIQLPPLSGFLQLYHSLEYINHSLDKQKMLVLQVQVKQNKGCSL